jgi:cysteine-S-conjugate beta-lyase
MAINFEEPLNRRASDSIKWNHYPEGVLPMWVADMDFRSAEPIRKALVARAEHGAYGYAAPDAAMTEVIATWCRRRYNWAIKPADVIMLPGLVSGLNTIGRAFGRLGDSTITLTPVYPPFLSSAAEQGMTAIQVPLVEQITGSEIRYAIDFDAFEKAITKRTLMLVLCQPENPAGREFTREELARLGGICIKHNLLICSDEIHCDLMLGGAQHTVFASVSPEIADRTITLMAPSKTFNIPGLGASFAVVQNPQLRQRLANGMSGIIPHVNLFGYTATTAAYTECDGWLAELLAYLTGNRDAMVKFISSELPDLRVTVPEATYLAFIDCKMAGIPGNPYKFFMDKAKVALGDGPNFGRAGEGFVRLNFGCPRPQLMEALERMRAALLDR